MLPDINIARLLMILGAILFLIGGAIYLFSRLGIGLFHLPGDIRFQSGNFTCVIPIVSSILLSLLLTILLNVIIRLLNR